MIIDTHCHYNLDPLYQDWQRHWQNAQSYGVTASVVVGTDLETSTRAIEIAAHESGLTATVGIHPNATQNPKQEVLELTKLLNQHPEIVAIGEVGLDYFRLPKSKTERTKLRELQQQSLRLQLELANQRDLPVILHVRDRLIPEEPSHGNAYWDTLEVLREQLPKLFVLHCISGPTSYLQAMLELGAYVGVAANVTYPTANYLRELLKLVPHDRLVLETDAPFLPPQSHRGQVCEPWMIAETAAYAKNALKITLEAKNSLTLALTNK